MLNVSYHFKSHSEILTRFHLEMLESLFIDHLIPSDHRRKKKSQKEKWLDSRAVAEWGSCHVASSTWLESAPCTHDAFLSTLSMNITVLASRPQPQAFCVNTPCFLWGGDSRTALQGYGWHVGWIFIQGLFSWSVFKIAFKGFWNITVKETSRNKSQGFM